MKTSLGYLRVSNKRINKDERLAAMRSATADVLNFRLLCDFQDGQGWHLREAWDVIQVHVACGKCEKLYLWDFYCINYNHFKIISFLEICRKNNVEIIFVNNPGVSLKSESEYNVLINYLQIIADRIRDYKSNKQFGHKNRAQRPALPDTVRNQIVNNLKEGMSVKEIQERVRWVRGGHEYKLGLSTLYREQKRYKDSLSEVEDDN